MQEMLLATKWMWMPPLKLVAADLVRRPPPPCSCSRVLTADQTDLGTDLQDLTNTTVTEMNRDRPAIRDYDIGSRHEEIEEQGSDAKDRNL
jgi:hypothetical protein